MVSDFHLYKISPDFFTITDWSKEKVHLKDNRPNLILVVEHKDYPDCVCCIPISKDDEKNGKYASVAKRYPNNVHSLKFNQYDNYALIQNFFFLRKEFVNDPFLVRKLHVSIPDNNTQKEINKKIGIFLAMYKANKAIPIQVDLDKVLQIQNDYLNK